MEYDGVNTQRPLNILQSHSVPSRLPENSTDMVQNNSTEMDQELQSDEHMATVSPEAIEINVLEEILKNHGENLKVE